jgi:predicted RNase H-like HicB family nuclease
MTTTMHSYRGYVFTIEFDPNPPGYIVDFPDLPDIITSGSTLAEAFANACEALDTYVETLEKFGQPVPPSRHRLVVEPVGSA